LDARTEDRHEQNDVQVPADVHRAGIAPVGGSSGTYDKTRDGFSTSDMSSTMAGYAGHDPVVLVAEGAIWSFGNGVHAKVRLTGDRLRVTVVGYLLICQRDGRQSAIAST
jgi:hypothetical protein